MVAITREPGMANRGVLARGPHSHRLDVMPLQVAVDET